MCIEGFRGLGIDLVVVVLVVAVGGGGGVTPTELIVYKQL